MLPTRTTVWLFVLPLLLFPAGLVYPLALWLFSDRELAAAVQAYLTDITPLATWLALGFDAGVFLLFLADAGLAYRGVPLRVRRDRAARLSLGTDNDIVLELENPGRRRVRV